MKVSTSILSCDDRVKAVLELNRTNTSYIHVDVMDGKFVEDVQFDTFEKIHSINLVSNKPLDIHLMVENPLEYIEQLSNMNIEFVTFHVEVNKNIGKIIKSIHDKGYKVGLAIKPNTDVKVLEKYLDNIDMILVMSVEPGRGGQKFINSSVDKINEVKELIGSRNILIEVDGGINDETIDNVRDVDIAVVGSYIVKSDNYFQAIKSLFVKDEEEINDKKNKEGLGCGGILVIFCVIYFGFLLWFAIRSMSVGFGGCWGTCATTYGIDAFIDVFEIGILAFVMLFWWVLPIMGICIFVNFIRKGKGSDK